MTPLESPTFNGWMTRDFIDHRKHVNNEVVLSDIIRRLECLEAYCAAENATNAERQLVHPMSASSVSLETSKSIHVKSSVFVSSNVTERILNCIESTQIRCNISVNVFGHLRMIESCYLRNKRCVEAVSTAMEQIEQWPGTNLSTFSAVPEIPRDLANNLIRSEFF